MPPFQVTRLPANAAELLEKQKKEAREQGEKDAIAQKPMEASYVNQAVSTFGITMPGKEYVEAYVKKRETLGRGRKRRKTLKRKSKKTKRARR